MFEWSIALKYLIPRRKSLSTALISLMSVLVISLVVWLVLVFLSVTTGIEKNWLQKLTSLHAPVRLSPTERYYSSYYYQIDAIAASSNYTLKTIGEKAVSGRSDPYAPKMDMEVPLHWPKPEQLPDGRLLDPVQIAVQELELLAREMPGLSFQDYEIGGALLRLRLERPGDPGPPSYLSQMSYLLSLTENNPRLKTLVSKPSAEDVKRLLAQDLSLQEWIDAEGNARTEFETPPKRALPWAIFVQGRCILPSWDSSEEVGALLPKFYLESGVHIGDPGTLSYVAPTAASTQEHRIRIRVAGFYDPGILPVGSRCLIVPQSVTRAIYGSSQTFSPDGTPSNGLFVWTDDFSRAAALKTAIAQRFEAAGIAPFWKISTYNEFEFSRDIMQQFQSDRTLFLLIAAIILIVACCNIISLLVLLVNDKRKEIAILQSMGASFGSIAAIFGLCGILMGAAACLIGSAAALFTLHHLDSLVSVLSALQGHAAFHPAFFGAALPNQFSYEALLFVLIATPLLSLTAGLIPALKASRIRPSSTLRTE